MESIYEKESSNNKNDEDKLINLIFSIDGERKILFQSNLKELTDNAIKKFLDQYELKKGDILFISNCQSLKFYKTIAENGLQDGSQIIVIRDVIFA